MVIIKPQTTPKLNLTAPATQLGLFQALKPGSQSGFVPFCSVFPTLFHFQAHDCYLVSGGSRGTCRMWLLTDCGCHRGKMNKSVSSGCGRRQAPETAMLSMAWIKGTGQGRTGSLSADSNRGKR